MNMYAYYLDKGHTLDHLINLSYTEKIFYSEAMVFNIRREQEKYKAMFGGK